MSRFPHDRLDVYRLARDLAVGAKELSDAVPVGYRRLSDQLIRSGSAVALLIAEGANRVAPAQKRQRFIEARGECGEAAATVEILDLMKLVPSDKAARFQGAADEIAAILVALIRKGR